MVVADLPPQLWLPPKPAIIQPAPLITPDEVSAMLIANTFGKRRSSAASDPYYADVILLLNGDGGSITDESPLASTPTISGNTTISATQSKYGTNSIFFDGTGDYISSTDTSRWDFGTGDWCVEMWVFATSPDTDDCLIDMNHQAFTGNGMSIRHTTTGGGRLSFRMGTTTIADLGSDFGSSTWRHVAMDRSGTSLKCWVDGTQVGSTATNSTNLTNNLLTLGTYIDQKNTNASFKFDGYMNGIRITKASRYQSAFTPDANPWPTS